MRDFKFKVVSIGALSIMVLMPMIPVSVAYWQGRQTKNNNIKGRILLQVQSNGEAWYLDLKTGRESFFRPAD